MVVRKNTLEGSMGSLTKKDGGYYVLVYSQAGGTKAFWSFVGKTRKEAVQNIKKEYQQQAPAPLDPEVGKRIWGKIGSFRKKDVGKFNSGKCVAIYTDYEWRYSGKNAINPTIQLFDASGINYDFIGSDEVLKGGLEEYRVVFCPGGFGYFPGREIKECFRKFIRNGGGFVGFCAGAFFSLKDQLDICSSKFAYFREEGFPYVILNPGDPLAQGIESSTRAVSYAHTVQTPNQRKCTIRMKMYRCNGPLLIARGRDKAVGYFDSTEDYSPLIRTSFGKGRVVSCSTHPDAPLQFMIENTSEKNLVENLKLFKNMILYAAKMDM